MDRVEPIRIRSTLKAGAKMGRDRHQEGRVVLRFRNVFLGLKAEMDKGQAKTKLRDIIAKRWCGGYSNCIPIQTSF